MRNTSPPHNPSPYDHCSCCTGDCMGTSPGFGGCPGICGGGGIGSPVGETFIGGATIAVRKRKSICRYQSWSAPAFSCSSVACCSCTSSFRHCACQLTCPCSSSSNCSSGRKSSIGGANAGSKLVDVSDSPWSARCWRAARTYAGYGGGNGGAAGRLGPGSPGGPIWGGGGTN